MSIELSLSAGDVELILPPTCSGQPRSLTASALASQERASQHYKLVDEPPLLSATITDLCNEPLFFSGYESEEEDCSSSETDDMSFATSSMHDDVMVESPLASPAETLFDIDANLPELLAEDCDFVDWQCNQAQAIIVVSAGRPKMIQVAKINLSASRRPSTATRSSSRMSFMSLNKGHTRQRSFQSTSSDKSTLSDTNHSIHSPEAPSTPQLESGIHTPVSGQTPLTPRTPGSDFFDSFASPTPSETSLTPTPKPRVRDSYRLKLPYMGKRSSPDSQPKPVETRHHAPLPQPPSYRARMVARGANERTPTFELPPFPGDDYMAGPKSARPSFTLRKDSFGAIQNRTQSQGLRRAQSSFSLNKR